MSIVLEVDNQRIEINRNNYKDFARELSLSYSIFKRLLDIRPQILLDDNACFYDIETDEKTGDFLFGLVNNIKFDDERNLLTEVQNYRVGCSFNGFRFDNEYLFKKESQFFKTIPYGNFQLHKIKGCINVDLLPVFMLWNPFLRNHQLNTLAKELGYKRKYDLSEKELKCREDILVMKRFYPYAKELLNWIETTYKIDPESVCILYYKSFSKLRRWFLQSWMMQQGIYPKLVQRNDKRKPSFYRYAKKGFYRNIFVWDAKSAYPVTAIKLNCSIYRNGDFAKYMRFLLEERSKHSNIQTFIKWNANSLIGDQNFASGLLRDGKILCDVWLYFKKVMQRWVEQIGLENIIYSYCDCVFTPLEHVDAPEGYKIKLKHQFKWLVIYNMQRLIGLNEKGEVKRLHFNRILNLKLFDYLDETIDEILKSSNPIEWLRNPQLPDGFLESLPFDAFKIVVFKKGNVVKNVDYLELWDSFHYGLNDVFLAKKGITTDPDKINYKRYNKYMAYYLGLHKFEG